MFIIYNMSNIDSVYVSKFYNNSKLQDCIINTITKYYNLEYKKDKDTYVIRSINNNYRMYVLSFTYDNQNIIISSLKKYTPEDYKFRLPILAMCICLTLIKYKTTNYMLEAIRSHDGLESCLTCYYQKFGFQPIDKNKSPL
jgi:hypothetical protein